MLLYSLLTLLCVSAVLSKTTTLDLTDYSDICDPALWCKDLSTARACNRVDYCIKWIWGVLDNTPETDNKPELCNPQKKAPNCNTALDHFLKDEEDDGDSEEVAERETVKCFCIPKSPCVTTVENWIEQLAHKTQPEICSKYNDDDDDDELITDTIECTLCKIAVGYLQAHNVTTKQEAETLCAKLGGLYKDVCDNIVDKGIDYIVNHTALEACTEIKMCNSSATTPDEIPEYAISSHSDDDDVTHKSDDDDDSYTKLYIDRKHKLTEMNKLGVALNKCAECIKIFNGVKHNANALELILELVCKLLLKGDKLCIAGIAFIEKELGHITAEKACTVLHACTKSIDKLGPHGDLCEFGPDFWCDSKENAIKCEATEFCTARVWKI